jgi:hypothetical protein
MTLLSFFLAFDLLTVLYGVLDLNFNVCAFCCQWIHQGRDYETKWLVHWFDCDESLTCRCLNLNPGHFHGSTLLSLFRVENHVCLSRSV